MEATQSDAALEAVMAGLEALAVERLENTNSDRASKPVTRTLQDDEFAQCEAALKSIEQCLDGSAPFDPAAAVFVRRLLSREQQPPIADVVQLDGVRIMTGLVQAALFDAENGQGPLAGLEPPARLSAGHEALWTLNNLASGATQFTEAVVDGGALDLLIQLAGSHPSSEIATISVWALGNIAGDCVPLRNRVLAAGGVDAISSVISRHSVVDDGNGPRLNLAMLRNAAWALSNTMRFKPPPPRQYVEPAVTLAHSLLNNVQDEETMADALWCFAYAVEGSCMEDVISYVCNMQLLPGVVASVQSGHTVLAAAALRLAGNVASGNDVQTEALLQSDIVRVLVTGVVEKRFGRITREVYWLFSNIAAGTREQIQRLFVAPEGANLPTPIRLCVRAIMHAEEDATPWEVQREAAWTISNCCVGGGAEVVDELIRSAGIGALVTYLTGPYGMRQPGLFQAILEGLAAGQPRQKAAIMSQYGETFLQMQERFEESEVPQQFMNAFEQFMAAMVPDGEEDG